ncbi:porin family protein [Dyadobacter fanqingshengii]|uniref:PorT family protein n=1 Tax=Dyadobacter fanqingshengii TaxID=2906443 RepID=A0A9X1PB50_9BACT|nr:porin family protein [Dyadobacter fanqingshengii]MCF0040032.1 PorT family protein [Dyadobacter fanqingshengii]MCF2502455.1 PorT family protein [Dyadobacter fanqingshengii]USJ38216.1 PorT family protein [Dyadobacter fanqingshengii]
MKKLLLAAALLISVQSAFAQKFSIGPKAGLNISNYTGGDIESDALVGYHLGGIINYGFGKVFSLQPEVLFSTQGAKVNNAGNKSDFKISYVTVPVMFKFKTNGGFYVEFGPQAGFRTSTDIPDQTINNFAKNLDLGAAAGIGYHSPIGLGVGVRYVAGLSKVGDFTGQDIDPDFKNSVIQASIFWAIPLVK